MVNGEEIGRIGKEILVASRGLHPTKIRTRSSSSLSIAVISSSRQATISSISRGPSSPHPKVEGLMSLPLFPSFSSSIIFHDD